MSTVAEFRLELVGRITSPISECGQLLARDNGGKDTHACVTLATSLYKTLGH